MSDLHLEFDHKSDDFWNALKSGRVEYGDVLVLAGDITIKNRVRWIELIAMNFKHVIYVFGNHEYYRGNLDSIERKTREALSHLDNVHVLQNESVTLDEVTFHGSTLWTDFNKGDPLAYFAAEALNDFKLIRCDKGATKWYPQRCHREHNISRLFLMDSIKPGDVVITHHSPSLLSIHPKYEMDKVSFSYSSDLSELILDTEPSLWFHGHTHETFDYKIGKTRILCNPRGYTPEELNPKFDIGKHVIYDKSLVTDQGYNHNFLKKQSEN